MTLTQLNNPSPCTVHSHLAPCCCSLHLPSPFTSPLQKHLTKKYAVAHLLPYLGSHCWHLQMLWLASLSSLRWSCYFSETETQEENQRWVHLPHVPAPMASCPWALTLAAGLAAKCSRAETEHSWDMQDDRLQAREAREDASGALNDSSFLWWRLWRPPQSESETPTGLRVSSCFSSKLYN